MGSKRKEILKCALSDDLESLQQLFQAICVTEEPLEQDLFGEKDEAGRNALLIASMLGRSAIVRELVRHGAEVDERTVRGYTSLHLASCWGHLETVRTLLELGADTQVKTFRGERPVDLARKYSKTDCADFLSQCDPEADKSGVD